MFTMEDIYNGDVTYRHDNSETTADSFTFAVTDQTNEGFYLNKDGQQLRTSSPLVCSIHFYIYRACLCVSHNAILEFSALHTR